MKNNILALIGLLPEASLEAFVLPKAEKPPKRYPQMVTSSPEEIAAWNARVDAEKRIKHLRKLEIRSM